MEIWAFQQKFHRWQVQNLSFWQPPAKRSDLKLGPTFHLNLSRPLVWSIAMWLIIPMYSQPLYISAQYAMQHTCAIQCGDFNVNAVFTNGLVPILHQNTCNNYTNTTALCMWLIHIRVPQSKGFWLWKQLPSIVSRWFMKCCYLVGNISCWIQIRNVSHNSIQGKHFNEYLSFVCLLVFNR